MLMPCLLRVRLHCPIVPHGSIVPCFRTVLCLLVRVHNAFSGDRSLRGSRGLHPFGSGAAYDCPMNQYRHNYHNWYSADWHSAAYAYAAPYPKGSKPQQHQLSQYDASLKIARPYLNISIIVSASKPWLTSSYPAHSEAHLPRACPPPPRAFCTTAALFVFGVFLRLRVGSSLPSPASLLSRVFCGAASACAATC